MKVLKFSSIQFMWKIKMPNMVSVSKNVSHIFWTAPYQECRPQCGDGRSADAVQQLSEDEDVLVVVQLTIRRQPETGTGNDKSFKPEPATRIFMFFGGHSNNMTLLWRFSDTLPH